MTVMFQFSVGDDGRPHMDLIEQTPAALARVDQERAQAVDKISEITSYAVTSGILSNLYPEDQDVATANLAVIATKMASLSQPLALAMLTIAVERFAGDFIADAGGWEKADEKLRIGEMIKEFRQHRDDDDDVD